MHGSVASEVQLKNVAVAVVPPPSTQLSVPATIKMIEELWMLHAYHGEEVLVAQVAPKVILVGEVSDAFRVEEAVVEGRAAHGVQIQQHHTAVEAGQAVRRGVTYVGLGVFFAILPEGVSEGKQKRNKTSCDNRGRFVGIVSPYRHSPVSLLATGKRSEIVWVIDLTYLY